MAISIKADAGKNSELDEFIESYVRWDKIPSHEIEAVRREAKRCWFALKKSRQVCPRVHGSGRVKIRRVEDSDTRHV